MADFDVLYPKNERQGFDGGLNNKFERHLIQNNESPSCLNVVFENGAVETRLGVEKLNTTSVGSFVGDGLYTRHDRDRTQSMCAWWNGSLYVLNITTFVTVPSAQSIFTGGVRVGSSEYENYIFFNNGHNIGYKYADGEFTRHGIYAPPSTSTASSQATGSLSGLYQYKVTFVNSALVESDAGPVTTSISVASAVIRLSSIPTAPLSYGVIRRKIYRTVNSGSTFLLVTTINDNTTTTYDDSTADINLGTDAPIDQGPPPKYSTIITHQNRLFCNDTENPNLVWYSELGNPYVFKVTNFEEIGDGSGDLVNTLSIHDNGLVVGTDNSQYLIYMPSTDPNDWQVIKLKSSYGSRSPFGNFTYENKVMFPAVQNDKLVGFAAIQGDGVAQDATLLTVSAAGSDMKSNRMEPDIYSIQSSYVGNISSIVHKNKAYLTVTFGTGETINNRIYVFDFSISNLSKAQEFSWVPWTGLSAAQFTIYNGTLFFQDSTATGFVREMNKTATYSDDRTAINSYFWTKEFSGIAGDEQFHKDFRYVNLLYEKSGDWDMALFYRVDSDQGEGDRIIIDLDPGGSLWGSMVWGNNLWGGGSSAGEDRLYLGQLRGKRIQFKFSNQQTAGQKFKVIGLQFAYNRKGRR